ncbi:MAG: hypothetical protein ABJG47_01185 [Ekhidna sp.]
MATRKKYFRILMAFTIITAGVSACHTDTAPMPSKTIDEYLAEEGLVRTKLGEKLENPYSLVAMEAALDSMKSSLESFAPNGRQARIAEQIEISTTDLYVRFLPRDSVQRDAMMDDTTMVYYDHPLDYEIEQEGDVYVDSTWTEQAQPWLYSVVKPDHPFPDTVIHELLSELFIPENHPDFVEPDTTSTGGREATTFGELLMRMETMSLAMTDNLPEEEKQQVEQLSQQGRTNWFWNRWFPPKWYPDGYVRVRERSANQTKGWLPVVGVRVRTRRWFKIRTDYTDARGYYRTGSFRRPTNYSVVFKTHCVKITNWLGWAGRHNGPKRKGRWDVYYDWHSANWVKATLVNAAYLYDIQRKRTGIRNPFPEGFWAWAGHRMNIRAVFKRDIGDWSFFRINRIRIYTKFKDGRGDRETDDLYALTFHELGHQSHYKLNRWNMLRSSRILKESWANFIEFYFTRDYYYHNPKVNLNSPTSIPNYDDETIRKSEKSAYTQLFVDLMDSHNQLDVRPGTNRANDKVRGYTFGQIQQAVRRSQQLHHVRDYLKSNYNNPTQHHLDELFEFYLQF